jgi:hypothetical protein
VPRDWSASGLEATPPGTQHRLNPVWDSVESNLSSSLNGSRRESPDSQSNPFATGSLVEALAEPSSASRHGPARPIIPRKATHKRQSSSESRHPSAPTRIDQAAQAARATHIVQLARLRQQQTPERDAAAIIQARFMAERLEQQQKVGIRLAMHTAHMVYLATQRDQGRFELVSPSSTSRQPLGAMRQPGDVRHPSATQPLQAPPIQQGPTVERRRRRVAGVYPTPNL